MPSSHVVAALCLALLSACVTPNPIGTRTAGGFTSAAYAMRVQGDGKSGPLHSSEWVLDNVQPAGEAGELVSKVGEGYERTISFDTDGDGSYETPHTLRRDELSFRHRRTNAQMSVSVLPMDQTMADTDMDVLVRNYVDAVSGGGSVSVNIGPGVAVSAQRRFATRVLDAGTFRVAGEPAAGATFEVANVDQMELSKDARWERARVVLIRAPWQLGAGLSAWPVLIRVLYSSRSESFTAHEADFAALVKSIDFDSYRSVMDAHAAATKACIETPSDRMPLFLALTPRGLVQSVRVLSSPGQTGDSLPEVFEGNCVQEGLATALFPTRPGPMQMAWLIDRDGKVMAGAGVAADAPAFDAGTWPPAANQPPTDTAESPTPSAPAAESQPETSDTPAAAPTP